MLTKQFKLERRLTMRTVDHGGQQELAEFYVLLQRRWWGGWTPVRWNEDDRVWRVSEEPHEFETIREAAVYAQRQGVLRVPLCTGMYHQ